MMNKIMNYFMISALLVGLAASWVRGQENQIQNSEFDDGLTSWARYGTAGYTVEGVQGTGLSGKNAVLLDITNAAAATAIGIAQEGLLLEDGVTYPIGFTARAEADREMVVLLQTNMNNTSWPTQLERRVELTTTPQTFVLEYTHSGNTLGDDATEGVILYLILKGTWWPMQGNDLNKKVWIDRVYFGAEPPLPRLDLADYPSPDDLSVDVPWVSRLSWRPGIYAATHNVYVGDSFEDVNSATVPTASGLDVNSFDPGRLEFDKTYFWRVDEVNGTPDKTVIKGDVWSFTAESYSVMIPMDEITATASSSTQLNPPDMTINGSGLNGMIHSTEAEAMWLSAPADFSPWLQYEFDKVEKLDQMWIWNSNNSSEGFIGWGVKEVSIETSMDGVDWAALAEPTQLNRAPGQPTYADPQRIDFGLVQAKYVRLDIQGNWGGLLPQYGMSEVQFFSLPVRARDPKPASGSVNVLPDAVVSWRAGRDAEQHTVYMSDDPNAVAAGLAPSMSALTNRVTLSPFDLQMGQTYYWRVDEVNEAEVPSVWSGPVWSLGTSDAVIVDDFDRYTNLSPNRPFQTWLDGFGYSADEYFPVAYAGNGTGAGIGHDIWSPSSPYYDGALMETASTMSGSGQSLPFYYTNTGGLASKTERTFAVAQDWTMGGAKALSIAFRGQTDNTGTLFAMINSTKVIYQGDPGDIALDTWQTWVIDLGSVNANLQDITKLSIGVEGTGAAGMLLIDDIQLTP